MKIIIDTIYTNDPQFCSMAFKMQNTVKYLIENTDDVYVVFLLPGDQDRDKWTVDEKWSSPSL